MGRQPDLPAMLDELLRTERACRKRGYMRIAGADEAGRGSLAGPVVAACVILPEDSFILGVKDSKKLSESRREELYEQIIHTAVAYATGTVERETIDEINILRATRLAFMRALDLLSIAPDYLYTDWIDRLNIAFPWEPVKKGDASIYCVAAASIVAKVTRDRLMRVYDRQYPQYGFAKHKGYGTKEHLQAIRQHGLTPIHRRSFLKGMENG